MNVVRVAVAFVLGIAVTLALQLWDKRRLPPEQRERCWNVATWGCALWWFGVLSMLPWMWVTRPRWLRCLWGTLATAALTVVIVAVDVLVQIQLGGGYHGRPEDLAVELRPALIGGALVLFMEVIVSAVTAARSLRVTSQSSPSRTP